MQPPRMPTEPQDGVPVPTTVVEILQKAPSLRVQCSVSCGSGQQTREVTCVGSGGAWLQESSCGALPRPSAARPCEEAACRPQTSWHAGDWGLCSVSCGSGSRERQVICSDPQRNLYPAVQCDAYSKPSTVERCTGQTCYNPQGESAAITGPRGCFSIERSSSSSLEMRAGQTARLPCTVVPPAALRTVSIQWTRDGRSLRDSRFTQNADGSLSVGSLKAADSGVYTCTASSQQQLEQRQLQLRVQANLQITTAPNNIQVPEGSTALLPCVVSGDNVNIGWSRNGVPVRPDGGDIQTSSDGSLILSNVKPSDEGTYTCNAYTGIYSVSATADVRVIRDSQPGADLPPECADQPELANCELIVYARLCSNSYYSSFCCASCTRHAQSDQRPGGAGWGKRARA
ncbi:Papilin [Liparis tanakae]|uniref:Papilin n=1 Tax=Liparis tanakae TaxID=230148 RepID=A0A4Z2FE00_9TELE|nr:Papilin [Liparis tanakae]